MQLDTKASFFHQKPQNEDVSLLWCLQQNTQHGRETHACDVRTSSETMWNDPQAWREHLRSLGIIPWSQNINQLVKSVSEWS